MTKANFRIPDLSEQAILETVLVRPLTADEQERTRYGQLMATHHRNWQERRRNKRHSYAKHAAR